MIAALGRLRSFCEFLGNLFQSGDEKLLLNGADDPGSKTEPAAQHRNMSKHSMSQKAASRIQSVGDTKPQSRTAQTGFGPRAQSAAATQKRPASSPPPEPKGN